MASNLFSRKKRFLTVFILAMFGMLVNISAQTVITIGTGTTQNTTYSYPCPYGQYWTGVKEQFLIPASEILSAGGGAGNITSLAFDVVSPAGQALVNLEIKIGTTSSTALSNWETGLTTVYSNSSYATVSGWNTHTFSVPFTWNGSSNIVIETCFDNYSGGSNYTTNAVMNQSSTSYVSTLDYHSDGGGVCTTGGSATTYLQRPNMRLTVITGAQPSCDLGIIEWVAPVTSTGCTPLTSTTPVTVKVKNWGTAAQSNFALSYSIDGGTTYITPETYSGTLNSGDTLTYTFTNTANFSVGGAYNCEAAVALTCDTVPFNDTLKNIVVENNVVNTFPYSQNFETWSPGFSQSLPGGWTVSTSSNPRWEVEDATGTNENSSSTGPFYDHTLYGQAGGTYMFMETSSPSSTGDTSILEGPCMDFGSANGITLKFWYHMYGSTMGSLTVDQLINNVWVTTGWTKTGQQHSSGSDAWSEAVVSINPAANKIRFVGIAGSSYYSDMSLDDIYIYEPVANDLSVIDITSPLNGQNLGSSIPFTIKVKNLGTQSQSNYPVYYTINGGTSWVGPETVSGPTAAGDTTTYTFTATASMLVSGFYDIGARVALTTDQNTSNDTLAGIQIIACNPLTGNYTVGGTSPDFTTIGDAVTALNSCGVSGPVTFNIAAGTYTEQLYLGNVAGVSATNNIVFKGQGTNTVITFAPVNSSARHIIMLDGAKHVTFDSLKVMVDGTATYGHCFHLMNVADSNTIKNCYIDAGTNTSSYFNGIIASASASSYSTGGNTANYLTIMDNNISGGYYGIRLNGSSSSYLMGNVIENNNIMDFYYYGTYLYYNDSPLVTMNYLKNSSSSGYVYAMYLYYCDNALEVTKNNIELNASSTNYGMRLYYCDGTASNPGLIANNFVSISGTSTSTNYGVYNYYSYNQHYYYNSISLSTGSTSSRALYHYGSTSSSANDIQLKNNIFANKADGYSLYVNTPANISASDYNNFYTTGSNFAYWSGSQSSLTALQTASMMDANSVSIDPTFVSNTDLHTFNPSMNNMGSPIVGITDDIDGDLRSSTVPDIGADEYSPINNDLAMIEWVSPQSGCALTSSEYVTVKIKNAGLVSQNFFLAGFSVDGGITVYIDTISQTILPGDTITYTFSNTVDLSVYGAYECGAVVGLPGDQYAGNDSIFATVYNELVTFSPFVEDFEAFSGGSTDGFPNGWSTNYSSTYYWTADNGGTSSSLTGPTIDHTYGDVSGMYLYTEASSGLTGATAEFISPCLDISGYSIPHLNFWYHMHGSTIDTLFVDINVNNSWINVFYLAGEQQTLQTDPWLQADIDLSNYSTMSNFRFRAQRGTSYDGDIAIDDIVLIDSLVNIVVDLGPDTAICQGASLTLDPGSGYSSYLWSDNSTAQTLVVTSAGTYIVTVTDGSGNTGSDTIVVTLNPAPIVNAGTNMNICYGSCANLSATGGVSYVWSDGSTGSPITVCPTSQTTYIVTVTDLNGCSATDDVMVDVYPLPTADAGADVNICPGICADLTATGGTAYLWSTGATTSTINVCPTTTTTYTVTVTDANSCTATDDVTVNVNAAFVVDLGADDTICAGTMMTLSPSLTDLFFSEYIEGSSNNKAIEIYNPTSAAVQLDNYRIAQSTNGGGWQYYHYFPTGATLAPGDVWVIVNASIDTTLFHPNNADEVLPYPSVVIHNGDDARAIEKSNDGGNTWAIVDIIGEPSPDPGSGWDVAGTNNATKDHTLVRKMSVCKPSTDWYAAAGVDTASSEWVVYPQNTFMYLGSHSVNCTQSYTYFWNTYAVTQDITVQPYSGSTYSVTVTDQNGCTGSDNIVLNTHPSPTANAGNDKLICPGTCDTLFASGGLTYMWSNGDTVANMIDCPVASKQYTVTVTNEYGCSDDAAAWIFVNPAMNIDLGPDFTICEWDYTFLNAGAGFAQYHWNTGDTNSIILLHYVDTMSFGPYTYYVDVTDDLGCMESDTILVTFAYCAGIGENDANAGVEVYPNPSSGLFNINIYGMNKEMEMSIYDMQGRMVYHETLSGIHDGYNKEINLSNQSRGVYYIKLMNEDEVFVKEIIIH